VGLAGVFLLGFFLAIYLLGFRRPTRPHRTHPINPNSSTPKISIVHTPNSHPLQVVEEGVVSLFPQKSLHILRGNPSPFQYLEGVRIGPIGGSKDGGPILGGDTPNSRIVVHKGEVVGDYLGEVTSQNVIPERAAIS